MDKLGIEATIIKGPNNVYKSAIEPFSREDMSPENEQQIQRLIDVLWKECQREFRNLEILSWLISMHQ